MTSSVLLLESFSRVVQRVSQNLIFHKPQPFQLRQPSWSWSVLSPFKSSSSCSLMVPHSSFPDYEQMNLSYV